MNIENVSIKLANIVLVFDDLINARISRDSLLDLIPDEENINHIDVGPLFVVKYPESKAEVIILNQERRAEIKIFQPEDDLWTLLPNLCSKVMNAIQESNLTAYGYNYFLDIDLHEPSDNFMVNQLSDSLINISNQIGEQITSSKIEIKYQKNGAMLNLSLNPSSEEENILSTKLNVHFLDDNLPPEENLVASFIENKDNFLETLNHIFEED